MKHQNCTGGIVGYIDRVILRESHVYQWSEIGSIYDALVFDPEGIFGCLATVVQVFLGVQCGTTLLYYSKHYDRVGRWIAWSLCLGAITAGLTLVSIEDGPIPINKNIWSLSFVTATTGLAFLLLSFIYFLVDVRQIGEHFWTIFLYPGMNAIILYVGHYLYHAHDVAFPLRTNHDEHAFHFVAGKCLHGYDLDPCCTLSLPQENIFQHLKAHSCYEHFF